MLDLSDLVPFLIIQDKLKISIYLSLDKYKCIKLIQFYISYFQGRRRVFKSGPAVEIIECRRQERGGAREGDPPLVRGSPPRKF